MHDHCSSISTPDRRHLLHNASALFRLAVPMIALSVLLGSCGENLQYGPNSNVCAVQTSPAPPAAATVETRTDPAALPHCSVYHNPASGRDEVIVQDIARTALLIGDSQAEPAVGWPREALADLGYNVFYGGAAGTGFVAGNDKTGNYIEALRRGDWRLPYGTPPLVVIQGGGNDATKGARDDQIVAHAEQLISVLRQRYPDSQLAMIGTLARGANFGGGRRSEVDALLGTVAAKHDIPFVSVGDWMTKYNLLRFAEDGIHLSIEGHKELAPVLGAQLKELGLAARGPGLGIPG